MPGIKVFKLRKEGDDTHPVNIMESNQTHMQIQSFFNLIDPFISCLVLVWTKQHPNFHEYFSHENKYNNKLL